MSIWYPESGITYKQYLQANSFVKDVTGEVRSSGDRLAEGNKAIESRISDQTRELVASNQQLAETFGQGFDQVNNTLDWGFNRVTDSLENIGNSIDSLNADFNYNMGLLIEIAQVQTELLNGLIQKLDALHETLKSPLLTQAREYFDIGRERLKRSLLDKALEAFKHAEEKNDTDFFTHFHLGKLYLQGVDEDDDVVDYALAKKHLLLAARYGKGELNVDPTFARFTAEAILHASIVIYAQLGETGAFDDEARSEMLREAVALARDAVSLNPEFSEAMYHVSKYSALLGSSQDAIDSLAGAISYDRQFALKAAVDRAFDPIRPDIVNYLEWLRKEASEQANQLSNESFTTLDELETWHPEEDSATAPNFARVRELALSIKHSNDAATFFGYTDVIQLCQELKALMAEIRQNRVKNLETELTTKSNRARIDSNVQKYSQTLKGLVERTNSLVREALGSLGSTTLQGYRTGLSRADEALRVADEARQRMRAEDEKGRQQDRAASEGRGLVPIGAIIGGVIGACGGILRLGTLSRPSGEAADVCGGPIIGAVIGAAIGAALLYGLGYLIGLGKKA